MASLNEDAVRAHVGAILASSGFANADRISRFLRLTVEMKLRGEEGRIKEFLLGQEVFDRGADYDPRLDPIVRVEARRLRQRLAEYYEGPGKTEQLRIEFPKGGYAPVILATQPEPRGRAWRWIPLLFLAAAGLAAVILLRTPQRPEVAYVPLHWQPAEAAVAELITAEMANQQRASVAGWPVVERARESTPDPLLLARSMGLREIVLVSVRSEEGRVRVTLFHLDAEHGRKAGARDYFAPRLDTYAERAQLAREIAAQEPVMRR